MNSMPQSHQVAWFIFQSNGSLLLSEDNTLPNAAECASIAPYFLRRFQLDNLNSVEYYCAEMNEEATVPEKFLSLTLRQALPLFDQHQYSLAVKAYSIMNWDRNHQFCGCCGALTTYQAKDFERQCITCGLSFFPRISPSVIVLIKKDDHLLMARSPHFPPGVYGLIAGFVNAGENIEEAVHREVKEEVGLTIKNLLYCGSQPWPFPDSLMIAFTADYDAGEITMDQDEIEDAGWYKYDKLPGLPSMTFSIAMKLIDDFVRAHRGQKSSSRC